MYESKSEISQLGKTVLLAYTSYTVYDKDYIEMKEKEIAEKTTLQLIEQF